MLELNCFKDSFNDYKIDVGLYWFVFKEESIQRYIFVG